LGSTASGARIRDELFQPGFTLLALCRPPAILAPLASKLMARNEIGGLDNLNSERLA
jgi:hypothetical protein